MAIGDLQLPLYPWGSLAPMMTPMAKAQSNVTASNIPGAKIPGPYDFLSAMTSLSNVQSENALRQQQMGLTNQQAELLRQRISALPAYLKMLSEGGEQPGAVPGMQPTAQPAMPDTVTGRDLGGGMQAGGAISKRVAQTAAATNGDVDPRLALATADIESSMGTNLGSRGNIFQLGSNEWNSVGGGKMGEPETDIKNGVAFLAEKKKEMALALGRDPTPSEIYLAHQQGTTGALKLITNPDKTPQALGLGDAVANNHGNPNAPASAFVNKVDGLVQARLAKYAPPDTVEGASNAAVPLADTPANQRDYQIWRNANGGTNKNATYDQYRAMMGNPGMGTALPIQLAQNGPVPSLAGNLPPQGSMPQGASPAPQIPMQMPGSFAPTLIGGKTPEQWARIGAYGEAIGMPNVSAPMLAAGQMDPNFLYKKALAEALAKLGPEMFQKWNIPTPVRSNTDLVNPSDPTRPIYRNLPVGPGQAYNNATGTASPIPGYVPNRADIVGTEEAAKETAKQGVKYGDLLQPPKSPAFPMGNAMPGTAPPPGAIDKTPSANLPTGYQQFEDKSIWTPRGTILPSVDKQTLPKTEEEAHPYVSDIWPKTVDSWTTAAPLAEAAEQRTSAMVDVMQELETKPFNTAKADIAAKVRSLFGDGVADSIMSAKDVSAVQFIMHNSVANSLNTLKSVNPRFSQMEFKVNTQNSVNPDITPAANREMAVNDLAMVRNIKTLPQDWLDAKRLQGWRNPVDFQTARMEGNPLKQQVESINRNLPPLKGEPAPPPPSAGHPSQTLGGVKYYRWGPGDWRTTP